MEAQGCSSESLEGKRAPAKSPQEYQKESQERPKPFSKPSLDPKRRFLKNAFFFAVMKPRFFRVGRSGLKFEIATERLQDKKNNHFEEVSVARKDGEQTKKRHAIIIAYLWCAVASPKKLGHNHCIFTVCRETVLKSKMRKKSIWTSIQVGGAAPCAFKHDFDVLSKIRRKYEVTNVRLMCA